jgi:hypothetical protein
MTSTVEVFRLEGDRAVQAVDAVALRRQAKLSNVRPLRLNA